MSYPPLYENGHRATVCGPGPPEWDTWRRCVFDEGGIGCLIYAWPRKGVVIKDTADIVDMAFLGFDRFDPPTHREKEQDKEDEFVRELLKIGGKFWTSQRRASNVGLGLKAGDDEERLERYFGWDPVDGSGGVWALEFDEYELEERPETCRLALCITMKERCTVLQKLGATFYEDPKECPGLKRAYADRVDEPFVIPDCELEEQKRRIEVYNRNREIDEKKGGCMIQ